MEGVQPVGKAPEGGELVVRYHETAEEGQRAVHQACGVDGRWIHVDRQIGR